MRVVRQFCKKKRRAFVSPPERRFPLASTKLEEIRSGWVLPVTLSDHCVGKQAHKQGMAPTPRTSFLGDHEDDDPGPELDPGYSEPSSAFSCGTSEGSRIWCNRSDTMGVVMATMAL